MRPRIATIATGKREFKLETSRNTALPNIIIKQYRIIIFVLIVIYCCSVVKPTFRSRDAFRSWIFFTKRTIIIL